MRPLNGITVVTLEHAIAAPFATRQLADLGARVIKIERPGVGDFARGYDERVRGLASHFVWTNRSKESLTLDVKHPEAQADPQKTDPRAGGRRRAEPRARRRSAAWALVRQLSGREARHHRVRHFRLRRRWSLPRQESLRPAHPERIRFRFGHRHGAEPSKAGPSIADIAAGMYAYSQHPRRAHASRNRARGQHLDISMLESLGEWMNYPLYYAFEGCTSAAHGREPRDDLSIRPVPGRRWQDRHARIAERTRMGRLLRKGAAPARARDGRALPSNSKRSRRAPGCASSSSDASRRSQPTGRRPAR